MPCTSTYWKTVAVSRLVSAFCTSGSAISGLTVRTKRSVLETWLLVQTETTATGVSAQPRTIRTMAKTDRQRNFCRGRGSVVRTVSSSRRRRMSSARSSAVSAGPVDGAAAGDSSCVIAGTSVNCRVSRQSGRPPAVRHHLPGVRAPAGGARLLRSVVPDSRHGLEGRGPHVLATARRWSDQRLRLQGVVLRLRDHAGVQETPSLGDLVGGSRLSGDVPDIGVLRLLLRLGTAPGPIGHAAAPGDQVDQRREEGQEDEGHDPDRLGDPGRLPVPEQVPEDPEHHHQIGHEGEADEDEPHNIPERRHRVLLFAGRTVTPERECSGRCAPHLWRMTRNASSGGASAGTGWMRNLRRTRRTHGSWARSNSAAAAVVATTMNAMQSSHPMSASVRPKSPYRRL